MIVAEQPPRRGRPPRVAGGTAVASARLSLATYDELYALARSKRMDVSDLIRAAIDQCLIAERRLHSR